MDNTVCTTVTLLGDHLSFMVNSRSQLSIQYLYDFIFHKLCWKTNCLLRTLSSDHKWQVLLYDLDIAILAFTVFKNTFPISLVIFNNARHHDVIHTVNNSGVNLDSTSASPVFVLGRITNMLKCSLMYGISMT